MAPAGHLAVAVDRRLDPLHRGGVVEAVLDVVLAGPLHPHRRAHLLREERRLEHVVALRLAPEAAAEQRHVHRDVLDRHPERCRPRPARVPHGLCTGAQTSTLPSATLTSAAGGSMEMCAMCGW